MLLLSLTIYNIKAKHNQHVRINPGIINTICTDITITPRRMSRKLFCKPNMATFYYHHPHETYKGSLDVTLSAVAPVVFLSLLLCEGRLSEHNAAREQDYWVL